MATMEHPGLLNWANSVRIAMGNDPGREAFKDQVQTIGFLFLDDYLDNIVSGAKQDPLIELVKTPGRKKVSKKPKLKPSKLGNLVLLEDDTESENVAPVNDFHKALLNVKSDNKKSAEVLKSKSNHTVPKLARAVLQSIQPTENGLPQPIEDTIAPPQAIHPPQPTLAPPTTVSEHNDLSIIAEDDEPLEKKRSSTSTHQPSPPVLSEPPTAVAPVSPAMPEASRKSSLKRAETYEVIPVPAVEEPSRKVSITSNASTFRGSNIGSTSSMDTFHSISLDTPAETQEAQMESFVPLPEPEPELEPEFEEAADMSIDEPTGLLQPTELEFAAPEPVEDTHMFDIDNTTSSLPRASEKPSFPALPEPMPLRKSIRAPREPSLNPVMLGAATPGGPGKRTSWLAKAREVKLLEVTSKRSHPAVPSLPPLTSNFATTLLGTKRKSGEMLAGIPAAQVEEHEHQYKVAKTAEGETASRKFKATENSSSHEAPHPPSPAVMSTGDPNVSQEGVLNMLKKTVEGLGGKTGRSMGKSVGGGAASALAEAKAAAEARLAERDRKEEEVTRAMGLPSTSDPDTPQDAAPLTSQSKEPRLSVSDLFPKAGRVKEKHRVPEKVFHKATPPTTSSSRNIEETRLSTSTTPPNSPPAQRTSFAQPTAPVFSKPVFVPPMSTFTRPASPPTKFAFRPPPSPPKYNVPPSMALAFGSRLTSASPKAAKVAAPLTAQSTLDSIRSDRVFDTEHDDDPAWMPNTQDTEFSTAYGSQSQPQTQVCDEDDSWPVDEKLAAGVQWAFGVSKEDSMTWSTLPSQSQRADTGPVTRTSPIREENSSAEAEQSRQIPGGFDIEMEDEPLEDGKPEDALMSRDEELEEVVLGLRPVVEKETAVPPRSQSQMSMASSESTQSQGQTGFLGQATKFLSSALGTGKKKQPEVKKVFSQAAVAAKKQQEEQDKKTTRMTNMEQRRQQALQRKAEEEKSKALQEEKRLKEEIERRKREREENTGKQPFKPTASKRQDDDTKKRKIEFAEKKPELKKPAPSMLIGKSHLKSAMKKSTTAYGSSTQAVASSSSMTIEAAKPVAGASSQLKMKASAVSQKMMTEDELTQPSQLMQSQMAARMKAQLDAAKLAIPSESIELPDINSEYSNSDDEDRVAPDLPDWAQSPELRHALEMQSRINPADIFGPVPVLRMEEIFKNQRKGFRARTSSANWNGSDRLTTQEEESYARRMGFK